MQSSFLFIKLSHDRIPPKSVAVAYQSRLFKRDSRLDKELTMLRNSSETTQCILIVDDDPLILQILSKILQKTGCTVDTAKTGQEALEKLQIRSYTLAVIDVRLQDMNGLDLLNRTQAIAPDMTKIILTGYPSEDDRARAIEHGANFYLAKPIKSEKLIEIVESTLKKDRSLPETP